MACSRWCQPPEQGERITRSPTRPGTDAGNGRSPLPHRWTMPRLPASLPGRYLDSGLRSTNRWFPLAKPRSTTGYYPWCLRHPSTFMECSTSVGGVYVFPAILSLSTPAGFTV